MGDHAWQHFCKNCRKSFIKQRELLIHMRVHNGQQVYKCGTCQVDFTTKSYLKIHQRTVHSNNMGIYSCDQCQKIFKHQYKLKRHLLVHSDDYSGKKKLCVFCGKRFSNNYRLEHHIRTHTLECPYFCTICGSERATLRRLQDHLTLHNPDRERNCKCNICGKGFFTHDSLVVHRKSHSTVFKTFKCDICLKDFKSKYYLRTHQSIHSDARPYECTICDWKFKRRSHLLGHIATHTGENRDKFLCKLCSHKSSNATNLRIHIETVHNPNRTKNAECSLCKRTFFTAENMKKHMKVHFGSRPFLCDICPIAFKTRGELDEHKAAPDAINGHFRKKNDFTSERLSLGKVILECIFCGIKVWNTSSLQNHILKHTNERPLFCSLCPFETHRSNSFRLHLSTHNSERSCKFGCSLCGRSFLSRIGLRYHLILHKNESSGRTFECDICHRMCNSEENLKKHRKTMHLDAPDAFQCTFCEKKFRTKVQMFDHTTRMHTAERQFSCEVCSRNFFSARDLRSHSKVHDPKRLKEFVCHLCGTQFFGKVALLNHINHHTKD